MGFRSGSWAKLWQIEPHEKFTKVRMSVSKKDKQTGEYVQEWSGFCSFIGEAHKNASKLSEGDRIRIGDCDVTNRWDGTKEWTNFTVYSFSQGDDTPSNESVREVKKAPTKMAAIIEDDSSDNDEDLPF